MENKNIPGSIFIAKSILWGLLLFGCITIAFRWQDITTAKQGNVVITATENSLSKTVTVSMDSVQHRIHIAQGILRILQERLLP